MLYPSIGTKIKCLKSFSKTSEKDKINFEFGKSYIITNFGRSYYKSLDEFQDVWYIRSLYDNGKVFSISRKGIEYLYNNRFLKEDI